MRTTFWLVTLAMTGLLAAPFATAGGTVIELDEVLTGLPGDEYGAAVAVEGDFMLVVAGRADGVTPGSGSTYMYERGPGGWVERNEWPLHITGWLPRRATATFSGNRALVTLHNSAHWRGRAYTFHFNGVAWFGGGQLGGSPTLIGYAHAGAVDGDTRAVGAEFDVVARVYRNGGNQDLTAEDLDQSDGFGHALGVSGDTVAVGAPLQDATAGTDVGAVYVYRRSGTQWSQEAKLVASDGAGLDRFGTAVRVEGDLLVASAPHHDAAGISDTGALYLFERTGTTWTETEKIVAAGGQADDRMGAALDLTDDLMVAGAPGYDGPGSDSGRAFVFRRIGSHWGQVAALVASPPGAGDRFGATVAVEGNRIVCGAPFDLSDLGEAAAGSVHVYSVNRFPSFCDASDNALASCPCANPGSPGSGCDLATGGGGVRAEVSTYDPDGGFGLILCSGFPAMGGTTAVMMRSRTLEASPVTFGDGLRCVGVPVVRVGANQAFGGTSGHSIAHTAMSGSGSFFYQAWFRTSPASFCTPEAFGASNGLTIAWP